MNGVPPSRAVSAKVFEPSGNAVTRRRPRFAQRQGAANQADLRITARPGLRLLKMRGLSGRRIREDAFPAVRHPGHAGPGHDIMSESGANSQICLECAAILRHLAVNDPVSAWGYTRAMMIKRILTILATVAAGTAGTSLALAQSYPQAPGSTYSRDPNYPPGGYPADYRDAREAAPDFDALEDDQAAPGQGSVALSPPGPILSPNDPRYGRPVGAPPVYSARAAGSSDVPGRSALRPSRRAGGDLR